MWGGQPDSEVYKEDVRDITWIELADGEVSDGEKILISGRIGENSTENIFIITDEDGIYYAKTNDGFDVGIGDEVNIWGNYTGNEKDTGLPIIDSKVIEKTNLLQKKMN